MPYLNNWSEYAGFQNHIKGLKLKHFAPNELLGSIGNVKNGITNEGPPSEVWGNIVPAVIILDHLRAEMGAPIRINSCYRFPAYNAVVPGSSKKSMHITFRAIDFQVRTSTPRDSLIKATDILKKWRADQNKWFESPIPISFHRVLDNDKFEKPLQSKTENGKHYFRYSGGIGLYDTFTHFDTRGYDANWDKRTKSRSLAEPVFDFDEIVEYGE